MQHVSLLSGFLLLVVTAAASEDVVRRAEALYQRTEYEQSLHVLAEVASNRQELFHARRLQEGYRAF
jgi:signal recognition particle receptor subunit beta